MWRERERKRRAAQEARKERARQGEGSGVYTQHTKPVEKLNETKRRLDKTLALYIKDFHGLRYLHRHFATIAGVRTYRTEKQSPTHSNFSMHKHPKASSTTPNTRIQTNARALTSTETNHQDDTYTTCSWTGIHTHMDTFLHYSSLHASLTLIHDDCALTKTFPLFRKRKETERE